MGGPTKSLVETNLQSGSRLVQTLLHRPRGRGKPCLTSWGLDYEGQLGAHWSQRGKLRRGAGPIEGRTYFVNDGLMMQSSDQTRMGKLGIQPL